MNRAHLIRQSMMFWQESTLAAILLMLVGWLPSTLESFAGFAVSATILLAIGLWLYEGSSGRSALHLLLYPLVIAAGILMYQTFDSLLLAALAAALLFWRIHTLSSLSYTSDSLQRMFLITLAICLFHLAITALFGSMMKEVQTAPDQLFPVLALLLAGYLLTSFVEYLTREQNGNTSASSRLPLWMGGQLVGSRLLLVVGYMAAGTLCLAILNLFWGLIKKPLGDLLTWLLGPVVQAVSDMVENLAAFLNKNQKVHDLLDQKNESNQEIPLEEAVHTGDPLMTLWQPYLIAGAVAIIAVVLGWVIWKRRKTSIRTTEIADASAIPEVLLSELPSDHADESKPAWDLEALRQSVANSEDDPVHYSYFRFLLHMVGIGLRIAPYETTQEYLRRLRQQWPDPAKLELAAHITRYYEQSRYVEKPLTAEELAHLQQCLEALLKEKGN
ncbi:DUF4129 domain-containing protein [Brevibacillus ruminantium]|uniref:DUF4129 domain-containing protein n=1 Tax=Brevibacillus ruminantium TaxID=2950604 RepID=A0ABY4WK87_9BACL|nr:DUF4129 domain-containing protein [Brevibacillus ruminantium]USG66280.1 DUF4129 domain-containing protein [Brevibacillus ruminantium]